MTSLARDSGSGSGTEGEGAAPIQPNPYAFPAIRYRRSISSRCPINGDCDGRWNTYLGTLPPPVSAMNGSPQKLSWPSIPPWIRLFPRMKDTVS